jgi:hypothetical protein
METIHMFYVSFLFSAAGISKTLHVLLLLMKDKVALTSLSV